MKRGKIRKNSRRKQKSKKIPALQEFHFFLKLPIELRRTIYELAFTARIVTVDLRCMFFLQYDETEEIKRLERRFGFSWRDPDEATVNQRRLENDQLEPGYTFERLMAACKPVPLMMAFRDARQQLSRYYKHSLEAKPVGHSDRKDSYMDQSKLSSSYVTRRKDLLT